MADAMLEEEATSYCKNCKRNIPQQNFQMHNLHCHRNVRLCKKCEEPVPISEMEDHNEEFHAMIECKCKAVIEKMNLEEHEKKDCLHRTVHCQYCEMDMKYSELFDHEHACGSRTEKCQDCGDFIMLKNTLLHVCAPPISQEPKTGSRNAYYNESSSRNHDNFSIHSDNSVASRYTSDRRDEDIPEDVFKYLGEDIRTRGAAHGNERPWIDDNYSSRTFRNDDRFADNFQDLGISEKITSKRTTEVRAKKRSATRDPTQSRTVSDGAGAATDRKLPLREAEKRSRTRRMNPKETRTETRGDASAIPLDEPPQIEQDSWDERYHERVRTARLEKEARARAQEMPERSPIVIPEDQGFELPCEICEALVPSHELEVHQESCLIAQQEAFKTYGSQATQPEEVVVVDDEEVDTIDVIPCEFCKERFPADNIILHQPYCDKNPQKHDNGYSVRSDERADFFQPMMGDADDFAAQRLREFSTEFETRTRNIFNEGPFLSSTTTERFSSIQSWPPFDSNGLVDTDDSAGMDVVRDDDATMRSERDQRSDPDKRPGRR